MMLKRCATHLIQDIKRNNQVISNDKVTIKQNDKKLNHQLNTKKT